MSDLCDFYEWQSGLFCGDYYCQKKGATITTDTYNKYCKNYNYNNCPIYKEASNSSSSCFITTVVCNILKKRDNDEILQNLRLFRNDILHTNKEYHDILKEYDIVGPILADCIINDKDKTKMAAFLYYHVLIPISNRIIQKNYDDAVEKYYLMTLSLVNYYGIKHQYNGIKKDKNYLNYEFDPKTSGHGLKKIKKVK